MFDYGLLKKNVLRYDYYIIRLSSRIGALLIRKPKDLVHRKTRIVFDNRLFGRVHPILGWNKNCRCKYYLKWRKPVKNDFLCI